MRHLILIGLLSIAFTLSAGDTIYQWTDQDGNTHFSDSPPPAGTEATERIIETMPNVGTVDPYLDPEETRKATADRVARENEALVQRRMDATTMEEQQAIECDLAEDVITKLTSESLVKVASPDGRVRVMGDEERGDRIRTSQKFLDENCL